ncbi:MAG: hypothetical protein KC656_34395, partial [Myxococcales bacterium]|nr:hypothetical protein [Myxococcales bacterium]
MPPPLEPRLYVSPMARGETMFVGVDGVPPGAVVHFIASPAGVGEGWCDARSLCSDLKAPYLLLGHDFADGDGRAWHRVQVPSDAGILEVWIQAYAYTQFDEGASDVVHRVLDDRDLDGDPAPKDCDDDDFRLNLLDVDGD